MTRVDPAYDLFRADAEAQGFDTLADYFRHYGIVPPDGWGRAPHAGRELPMHDSLDFLSERRTWTEGYGITKDWGEGGKTILTPRTEAAA